MRAMAGFFQCGRRRPETRRVGWGVMNRREQFYPAMLYLSTSKLSIAILGNLIFAVTLLVGQLMKRIFLGTLRESEVERLQVHPPALQMLPLLSPGAQPMAKP